MVPLYEEHLFDTVISDNTDLSRNKISESIVSVLSYIHIGSKNTWSAQAKHKMPQILSFTKWIKVFSII